MKRIKPISDNWIREPRDEEYGDEVYGDGNEYEEGRYLHLNHFDSDGNIKGPWKLVNGIPVDSKGNDITHLLDWQMVTLVRRYPANVLNKHKEHFAKIRNEIIAEQRLQRRRKFWANVLFGAASTVAVGVVKGRDMYDSKGRLKNHYLK